MKKTAFAILASLVLLFTSGSLFAADPTVVRYSRWAGGSETTAFQAVVDKFNATVGKEKNIVVKFEPLPWGTYWDKLRTTILAGDAPDVISLSNAGENASYLTRGVFATLDKMPGAKEALANLAASPLASLTVNGKTLGVPVGLGVRTMIYNKQVLKAAGVAYPDPVKPMTWEQFVDMAKKVSKKGDQYLARFQMSELADTIVTEYGANFLNSRTKATKVTINTPEGIKALQFVADLTGKNQVVPPDNGQWDTPFGNPDNGVGTGKTGFILAGPWAFGNFTGADAKFKKEDFGTAPLPVFAGKEKFRASRGYINGLAIFRASKVQPAAWEFVKWMVSKEGQLEFTKTGDLPANTKALAEAQANAASIYTSTTAENYKAYFADLPYVIAGPSMPTGEWTALYESVINDLIQGKVTAAAAAAKLEKDGNEILESVWD